MSHPPAPVNLEVAPAVEIPAARPPGDGQPLAGRHRRSRAAKGPGAGGGWSAEVQALRAVAVLLVVGFHLWPGRVPGGYVGVDVFFVISGFLISGHILRDLERGRFTLRGFYTRRIRRLLPAAMLVLLVVAVAVPVIEPHTRWVDSARQVLASAGYAQNWVLALSDVDYLDPHLPPTAVQHFWSLSVEEQFYVVWPLLLLVTGLLVPTRRPRARRAAFTAVMAVIAVGSFAHGVLLTSADPTRAYFVSPTRVWEFAAGALLVLTLRPTSRHRHARGLLAWAGLAAITAAALLYTQATPFPGVAALLPVAGTLAFLAAGRSDGRWSPGVFVRTRAAQFFGDASYSLYLWHWPVVMLAPAALDQTRLTPPQKLVVLPLTVLLAWASLRLVEDRFRSPRPATGTAGARAARPARPPRTAPALAVLTAAVLATAGGTLWTVHDRVVTGQQLAMQSVIAAVPCFGAPALDDGCRPPYGRQVVVPDPAGALTELRGSYAWRRCFQTRGHSEVITCTLGDPRAATHVVLLGDSHALQWVPAITPLLADRDWRLTTVLRAACPPNPAPVSSPSAQEQDACATWAADAVRQVERDRTVDLVLTTAYDSKRWIPAGDLDSYWTGVDGYRRSWQQLTARGTQVVALHDTPTALPGADRARDCVARDPTDPRCGRGRAAATRGRAWKDGLDDPMAQAFRDAGDPRIHLVDLTDRLCGPRRCPAVIGNVLVYADDDHMTPTFARTLSPALGRALDDVLPASLSGATRSTVAP